MRRGGRPVTVLRPASTIDFAEIAADVEGTAPPVFVYFRLYLEVSSQFVLGLPGVPLDRALVFPMVVVPNAWGAWNMLHLAAGSRLRLPLGLHGALLPLLLMPAGFALARALDVFAIQWTYALPMAPIGMAVYYLA